MAQNRVQPIGSWRPVIFYILFMAVMIFAVHKLDEANTDAVRDAQHQADARAYSACLLTNHTRQQSNAQWAAVKEFFLEASQTRALAAANEPDGEQKQIDLAASKQYAESANKIHQFEYNVCVKP
jgi:hypothetical protein